MTKSELIEKLSLKQSQLTSKDVEFAVKTLTEQMAQTLASGGRIEIRGFGSFCLHYRPPRISRNPKTGEAVAQTNKQKPQNKPKKKQHKHNKHKKRNAVACRRFIIDRCRY